MLAGHGPRCYTAFSLEQATTLTPPGGRSNERAGALRPLSDGLDERTEERLPPFGGLPGRLHARQHGRWAREPGLDSQDGPRSAGHPGRAATRRRADRARRSGHGRRAGCGRPRCRHRGSRSGRVRRVRTPRRQPHVHLRRDLRTRRRQLRRLRAPRDRLRARPRASCSTGSSSPRSISDDGAGSSTARSSTPARSRSPAPRRRRLRGADGASDGTVVGFGASLYRGLALPDPQPRAPQLRHGALRSRQSVRRLARALPLADPVLRRLRAAGVRDRLRLRAVGCHRPRRVRPPAGVHDVLRPPVPRPHEHVRRRDPACQRRPAGALPVRRRPRVRAHDSASSAATPRRTISRHDLERRASSATGLGSGEIDLLAGGDPRRLARAVFGPVDGERWDRPPRRLVPQLATTLESAQLVERSARSHRDTIAALSRGRWRRRTTTRAATPSGSSEIAVSLARRLGYSGVELDAIEIGALLHDIGKIGIPERDPPQAAGPLTEASGR